MSITITRTDNTDGTLDPAAETAVDARIAALVAPPVNVKNPAFGGAVGGDWLTAFGLAVEAALEANAPLYIPADEYTISGMWDVTATGLRRIYGDGPYRSLIRCASGDYAVKLNQVPDIIVEGLGAVNTAGAAFGVYKSHRSTFRNLLASPYCKTYGFHNFGSFEVMLDSFKMTTNGVQPWTSTDLGGATQSTTAIGIYAEAGPDAAGTNGSFYINPIVSGIKGGGFKSVGATTNNYGGIFGGILEGNGTTAGCYNVWLEKLLNFFVIGTHLEGASARDIYGYNIIRCTFQNLDCVLNLDGDDDDGAPNDALTSDNIFISCHIKSGSVIGANAYRTRVIGGDIEGSVKILNPTTFPDNAAANRIAQRYTVIGTVKEGGAVLNRNGGFDRWVASGALPDGYVKVGTPTLAKVTDTTAHSPPHACSITADNSGGDQGIGVEISSSSLARSEFVSASVFIRRPEAYEGTVRVQAAFDDLTRSKDFDATNYPADEWHRLKVSFSLDGAPATSTTVAVVLVDPAEGDTIDVDSFEVSRGLSTYSHGDRAANEMDDLMLGGTRQSVGTAAPTTGDWLQGDIVWNSAPAAAGSVGWVCTASGTPGTWKAFGSIAS